MNPLLSLEGVEKSYPGFTLDNITFQLPPGAIMGFIGPNGSGKTTVLKAIMNLIRLDAGAIRVFGLDHRRHELEIKKRIGFISEDTVPYAHLPCGYIAQFVSQFYPSWDPALFQSLVEKFGLHLDTKFGHLSKGSRMKFSLVLALARRPELLLLDEPTSGLDAAARRDLLEEMLEVIADGRRSVLFSSHITSDLERVADYITVIHDGRLHFTGLRDDLHSQWRRLLSPRPFPPEVQSSLILEENRFGGYMGITGDFPRLRQNWPGGFPGDITQEALSLEEIIIALVRRGR